MICCDDRVEQLSVYIDRGLSAEETAECERHLFRCEACREYYRDLRVMRQALTVEITPVSLPLKLDLSLTAMTEQFLAADPTLAPHKSAPFVSNNPFDTHSVYSPPSPLIHRSIEAMASQFLNEGDKKEALQGSTVRGVSGFSFHVEQADLIQMKQWFFNMRWQMGAAACVFIAALTGMSFFAYQGGAVPTLTATDYRISGLSAFGNELLHQHKGYELKHKQEPSYGPETLQFLFKKKLDHVVIFPKHLSNPPVDGRVVKFGEDNVPLLRYEHESRSISLFTLPTERAIELLELDTELSQDTDDVCQVPKSERCYENSLGESLCIQHAWPSTRIWIGDLPQEQLARFAREPETP